MGILVTKPVLVVQCSHCGNAKAFWSIQLDGSMPPDLWFENFPVNGRLLMTNQVIYLACSRCKNGLDQVYKDEVKPAN